MDDEQPLFYDENFYECIEGAWHLGFGIFIAIPSEWLRGVLLETDRSLRLGLFYQFPYFFWRYMGMDSQMVEWMDG